jgi:hypothetical protein
MKCCFDTNVLDWILDNPRGGELMDAVERNVVSAIVAADNAYEVHRIPDAKADRRERLQTLLAANFFPLAPTHIPIMGIARLGLARLATPHVMALREQLGAHRIEGLDANHLINASREHCTLFVTLDKGILNKHEHIGRILGLECQTPEELLARVTGSKSREAG